jgi:hypothetical protein
MQDWLPRRGEITEIVGPLSSGRTSLCLRWLAAITTRGAAAALVDSDQTFDPSSALAAGVDLNRLLWVRCRRRRDTALRATDALVRCSGFALVVLDTGEIPVRLQLTAAFRLKLAVRRSGVALVILTRRRVTGSAAAVAIETMQAKLEWAGATPQRLDALCTTLQPVRPRPSRISADDSPPSVTWRWSA